MNLNLSPSRVAAYMMAGAGLMTATAPLVAQLQTDDLVGLVIGCLTVLGAGLKWLDGRSKWETTELQVQQNQQVLGDTPPPPHK